MELWKLGLLAIYYASAVLATNIAHGPAAPARETGNAELIRTLNGISPAPTSPPKLGLAERELLKRVYILPPDVCGWFNESSCECTLLAFVSEEGCVSVLTNRP